MDTWEAYFDRILAGELDTEVPLDHPTYSRATAAESPMTALTLTTYAHVLRGTRRAAIFGHRLYAAETDNEPGRRRILSSTFAREVAHFEPDVILIDHCGVGHRAFMKYDQPGRAEQAARNSRYRRFRFRFVSPPECRGLPIYSAD